MAHRITLSNNTTQYYFAGSPVVVTVQVDNNTFPESASLRRMNILVECLYSISGHDYRSSFIFSGESDNGESFTADISTALRAAMSRREITPASTAIGPRVDFKVTVYASWLQDGEEQTERDTDRQVVSPSEEDEEDYEMYRALSGMFTEMELLEIGRNRIPLYMDFSTKPAEGGIVYPGHRILYAELLSEGPRTSSSVVEPEQGEETWQYEGRTYYIEREEKCFSFLFLNRRGQIEDACCISYDSLQYNIDKKEYEQHGLPSETPVASLRGARPAIRRSYLMSSGYCSQEMADWWITEFLASEKYWLMMDNKWIPVSVAPSNKKITEYDRANPGACSVNFTVTLGLEG